MRRIGNSNKIVSAIIALCCILSAILFFTNLKNLSVSTTDVSDSMVENTAMNTNNTVVMGTDEAILTEDYVAFGVYAPSTEMYTIGVSAENGKMRINTEEAITVEGTEISVSLTEGTNVLYFEDCENPSIHWDTENCGLQPINKVCMPLTGDVNMDGNRSVEDLVKIKKEAALSGTGNIERIEIADVDGTEQITEDDADYLRRLMVGTSKFEVPEHYPLIVDAYIEENGTLYDTLADAIETASEMSILDSKSVTVTVLNPTDVKLVRNAEYLENYKKTISIPITDGAKIVLKDDGTKDNGWCRTITRGSTENFKMFAIGAESSLTLIASSETDEKCSLILDGGAKPNNGNHVIDAGNTFGAVDAEFTMNKGVMITNNENNGASSSGGALAIKGIFHMNGGVISGNMAKGTGGAINLLNGSVMNMADGIITGNETGHETSGAGAVNVSNGAALIMTGGTISENVASESVGNNSVRLGGADSVLKMEGAAYIDNLCMNASIKAPYIELTGALTIEDKITIFYPQPLNKTDVVVKRNVSYKENDALFQLSEHMLPCTLEEDVLSGELRLKSSTEGMESVKAYPVYSNYDFEDVTWAVQGVCTDGTYLYAAIEKEETIGVTFDGCKILKVKLGETWETAAISDVLSTDHSNEMTYNPTTGKIYITHCMSSGAFTETTGITEETGPYAVSVVDPTSLTLDEVVTLSNKTTYTGTTGTYALSYNNSQGFYVAGCTGFRFGFLDGTLKEAVMPNTGMAGFLGYTSYTKQGVYANDTTIYTNNWNDKEQMNYITMYDWSGNYNGTQYVVDQNGNPFVQESESMFEYNGDMYMACIPTEHIGVDIYKLDGVGTASNSIDVIDADGTIVDGVYRNLAEAITKANELGEATLVLKADVTIGATQAITGNITIIDDGTQRTLKRNSGCVGEMFNVSEGAELTFTSSSLNDNNPMLIIDGNKENITISTYAPIVDMNQTDGILNIMPGVVIQNNKSNNSGGVIFAGANKGDSTGGSLATINITGGLFKDNEVVYSSGQYLFGGCIYIESGATLNISNATFDNTQMTQNHAKGMTYGGVISVRTNAKHPYEGANVTIDNCIFKNTTVTQKGSGNGGGVLYIGAANPNSVQVTNCEFINNTTEGLGGAIYMYNSSAALELSGCTFSDNADVNGANDIYCTAKEQIYIADTLGTESVIKVQASNVKAGDTVVTFASEEIMNACITNANIVLMNREYVLQYEALETSYVATLVDSAAEIGNNRYTSFTEAIDKAITMESNVENPIVITLLNDTVAIERVITIPTGTFVEIIDDGNQRTLQRTGECVNEMFNVEGGAGLTFTSSSLDDNHPTLFIDGNKENVTTSGYAPIVDMNQTDGVLNITSGVVVENNKSKNSGGVILAGANKGDSTGGSLATINITGGLFKDNEVVYSSGQYLFGGCIYIESGATLNISNATFDNTKMAQNNSKGMTYGGVISVRTNAKHPYEGANVTIDNCVFKNTKVTQKGSGNGGGVLYIGAANPNSIQVSNCEFVNNTTQGFGGAIYMYNSSAVLMLSGCSFSNNADVNGENDIYCTDKEQIYITDALGTDIVMNIQVSGAVAGDTVVTFASEAIMNACVANENIVLTNREYVLSYETTEDSRYVAKLVDVVAEVDGVRYLSLTDAVTKAVTMESDAENPVVVTLMGNTATVDDVITIPTGKFIEITDDGTARTIKRQGFNLQMFVVEGGAGLTLTATSEDKENPSLTLDGNKSKTDASKAMISLGSGDGVLTVNGAVRFTNANIGEDGGIIRTEDGGAATITANGAIFDNNNASISANINGGLIRVSGSTVVTISNATFENNTIKSTAGAVKGGLIYADNGIVNIVGTSFDNNIIVTKNTGNGGVIGNYGGIFNVGKYVGDNEEIIEGACFFTNNSFTSTGGNNAYGGVFGIGGGSAKIYNSEVAGNISEYGGAANLGSGYSLTIGDCVFGENTAKKLSTSKDLRISGTVIFEGKVITTVYSNGTNRLKINGTLDTESQITVTMKNWTAGNTVVTFDSEAGMTACQTNGNLVLTDSTVALSYESTETNHTAKLSAVE